MSGPDIKKLFAVPLSNAPGKTVTTFLLDYAPGEKSPPHRHGTAIVVAYVLSGKLRSQVEGEPVQIYKAGEHLFEPLGAHHFVCENASKDQNLKLLCTLIHDSSDQNIVDYD
ncbi:cupin domain-containing protein [Ditylenchus destructor]|uniref:Cupin domain-containing protein n=1 Tax=Ditylenchus destructor TaxID=166010 RepID=A0AAD4MM23_9BILA|nr:cupin domain-containing protein [Ditylenchus destructor]